MPLHILRSLHPAAVFLLAFSGLMSSAAASGQARSYYALKVYHLDNVSQLERVDQYLKNAYVPAAHRAGVSQVGVFRTLETDTSGMRMYVVIPFSSLASLEKLTRTIERDPAYQSAGSDYINASYQNVPYARVETIILEAFPGTAGLRKPRLTAAAGDRIYELRSYEGPTEKYHASKLKMFNQGGEIGIFNRIGSNGMFYGEVLAGSHMPNLMYMTCYNNMADRTAHWKTFSQDPGWKKLSATAEYQHNVSRADIVFLHPTDYSDL